MTKINESWKYSNGQNEHTSTTTTKKYIDDNIKDELNGACEGRIRIERYRKR